jgi:hypothetical protein
MATLYGDNRTKALTPTSDNVLSPGTLGGRVRVLTDVITLAAANIADVIEIGKDLQAGAIILGIEINNAALGGGVTLDVGDADTATRYITAYDANGNTKVNTIALAGVQYKIGTNDDDQTILLTIGGAAATGELKINVFYTED